MSIRSEYNDYVEQLYENHQASRSKKPFNEPNYLGYFIGAFLTKSIAGLFSFRLTVVWLALWIVVLSTGSKLLGIAFMILFAGIHVGSYFVPSLRKGCAFAADLNRRQLKAQAEQEAADEWQRKYGRAQDFLDDIGLLQGDELLESKSWVDEDDDQAVFHWRDNIKGRDESDIARAMIKRRRFFKAVRAEVREDDDMFLDVIFFKNDPLDKPHQIFEPMKIDLERMKIDVGVLSDGSTHCVEFKQKPVSLFGGESGSGKTIAVQGVLTAFAGEREDVELHIIDNKGGDDWSAFEPVSRTFMPIDGVERTIEDVRNFALALQAERARRTRESMANFGTSDFWDATPEQRRAAKTPFIFVVVDECQELFETKGKKPHVRQIIDEIDAIFTSIAKMGRSTGIHVMFITQKPTAESMPVGIRNQARLRVALSVQENPAEEAILGPAPEALDVPRATSIPATRPGGAVFADDRRNRWMGRFFFFEQKDQIAYLEKIGKGLDRESETNFMKTIGDVMVSSD